MSSFEWPLKTGFTVHVYNFYALCLYLLLLMFCVIVEKIVENIVYVTAVIK